MADEERTKTPAEGTEEKPPAEGEPITDEGEGATAEEVATAEEEGEATEAEANTEEAIGEEGEATTEAAEKTEEDEVAEETTAVEETTEETPAAEEETPADEEDAPAAEEETPAAEEETPAAEEEAPADQEETPAVEEETAAVEEEPTVVEEETTVVEEETTENGQQDALSELSAEERETFEELFNLYAEEDDSGEKSIGKVGMKLLFRYMGEIIDEETYKQWLAEEDKDADRRFNLEEFCSLYCKKRKPEDRRIEELLECVNQVFPVQSGDDDLDLEMVARTMRKWGQQKLVSEGSVLTEGDIQKIIKDMDTDKSKKISRTEFVTFLCRSAQSNGQ